MQIMNLSKHGLLATTNGKVYKGEILELHVKLVVYSKPIRVTAKVARITGVQTASGMGMEFIKIGESDREKLSSSTYINRLLLLEKQFAMSRAR